MSGPSFAQLAAAVSVMAHLDACEYLEAVYDQVKSATMREADKGDYTYKAFSEDLGLGRTNLSYQLVRRLRPLTLKTGERIARALALEGQNLAYFLALIQHARAKDERERTRALRTLFALRDAREPESADELQLEFFGNWYHSVILEMACLEAFRPDPHWIAKRVSPPVSVDQARRSLALLERIGYLRKDPVSGRYVQGAPYVSTGDEVLGLAVTRYTRRFFEIGADSLERVDPRRREVSTVTAAVSDELAIRLKREVQEFRRRFIELVRDCPRATQVIHLNLQLFPMTDGAADENEEK